MRELEKVEEIEWLRVMYQYPSLVDDELLETFAKSKKIVKYFDIPLQHSHPEVLKRMLRPVFDYRELIAKIRGKIPNVVLRTTFIAGYPGETQEEFEHLYDFVNDMKFDKLGVFEFCREKNTYASKLKNQIPKKIKTQRKKVLMELQQKISLEINKSLIGRELPAIVEGIDEENNMIIARTYRDAPEVDGLLYIRTAKNLIPADIINVKITDADEYDLYGST